MRGRLLTLVSLAILAVGLAPGAGDAAAPHVDVSAPVAPVLSAPLRDLPTVEEVAGGGVQPSGRSARPRMPSPIKSFQGMSWATTAGYSPADPNGDVGPNHYVQMVNASVAVYDKSGTLLAGPTALSAFWTGTGTPCDGNDRGDPVVLYDEAANRWLISQFIYQADGPPYYECVAISTSPDPTGTWYEYAFQTSTGDWPDYPKLGVWDDAYYMTANMFDGSQVFQGVGVWAFERDAMLTGAPADRQKDTISGVYGVLPADVDGPNDPPGSEPGTFVGYIDYISGSDKLRVFEFDVDWATPSNSTFSVVKTLTVDAFDSEICLTSRDCVPQPGTSQKLDALSGRLMFRLAYRNYGSKADMVVTHVVDWDGRAAIRWYQLRKPGGGSWSVQDQGTWKSNSIWRWNPSAALDKDGNIAIGYSVSNSVDVYPGLRYAGRLASDPPGTLGQGETTLINGSGSQTNAEGRWGDYASMSVDPTNDCTFWFTSMYQPTTASLSWMTRIASFKFPSCGKRRLSIGDRSRSEGDSGTTKFSFTVSLSSAHTKTVKVDWTTVEDTALAPSDFSSASGTVRFSPGQASKTVTVLVNGDTKTESNEKFKVKLSNPTNAAIVGSQGTGTIENDD